MLVFGIMWIQFAFMVKNNDKNLRQFVLSQDYLAFGCHINIQGNCIYIYQYFVLHLRSRKKCNFLYQSKYFMFLYSYYKIFLARNFNFYPIRNIEIHPSILWQIHLQLQVLYLQYIQLGKNALLHTISVFYSSYIVEIASKVKKGNHFLHCKFIFPII